VADYCQYLFSCRVGAKSNGTYSPALASAELVLEFPPRTVAGGAIRERVVNRRIVNSCDTLCIVGVDAAPEEPTGRSSDERGIIIFLRRVAVWEKLLAVMTGREADTHGWVESIRRQTNTAFPGNKDAKGTRHSNALPFVLRSG